MSELSINRVNIMMGHRCNFKCRYCLQVNKLEEEQPTEVSSCVIDYIKHLAAIRPSFASKLQINFWGGEPLLYFPVIKDFVSKMQGVPLDYLIVTNGTLLTEDIVKFVNVNNITVIVSNDGEQTDKTRGLNMLENDDFTKLFKKINSRGTDSCISAYTQDYYKLWNYIDSKLGEDTQTNYENLQATWDMPKDVYDFDFDAYKKMMLHIADEAYHKLINKEISRELLLILDDVKRVEAVISGKPVSKLWCGQLRLTINVDLIGNVYACHNGNQKIGTVYDSLAKLQKNHDKYINSLDLSDCDQCSVKLLCGYGCPGSKPSKAKQATCTIRKIRILAAIRFLQHIKDTVFEEVDLEDSYVFN